MTTASTLQDAINAFVAKGRPNSDIIRRPEGYTVVAMGRGTYNPGYKNVVASRIEQRSAYVEAFMDAKGRMAREAHRDDGPRRNELR